MFAILLKKGLIFRALKFVDLELKYPPLYITWNIDLLTFDLSKQRNLRNYFFYFSIQD